MRVGASAVNIDCMMDGTPAMTCVGNGEARCDRHRVGNRDRPARQPCHTLACSIEILFSEVVFERAKAFFMDFQRNAHCFGNAGRGDVVMGRADAACGENVVIAGATFRHGGDDDRCPVGDDPDFVQRNPDPAKT